jgi:hypothetical protein
MRQPLGRESFTRWRPMLAAVTGPRFDLDLQPVQRRDGLVHVEYAESDVIELEFPESLP